MEVLGTKYEVENRRKYETRDTKQMSLVSCLPVGRQVSRLLLLNLLGTLYFVLGTTVRAGD